MSVAPNTASSTNFTLPASGKIETGASSLVVVANGIASQPAAVTVVSGTNYTLSVSVIGSPGGRVTSSPSGIDCGATCAATFAAGTQVTLTASPAPAWGLAGWSGACSGIANNCAVTLGSNTSVAARFKTLFSAEASPTVGAPELLPPLIAPVPQ
jgi:Divergent InlB B-repeat domain